MIRAEWVVLPPWKLLKLDEKKYVPSDKKTKESQAGHAQRKTQGNTPPSKLLKTRDRQETPKTAKRDDAHKPAYAGTHGHAHAHIYTHKHVCTHRHTHI